MIIESPTRLRKLKKYLLKDFNISWEQYLERFEGTKPLKLLDTDYSTLRL